MIAPVARVKPDAGNPRQQKDFLLRYLITVDPRAAG